MVLPEKIYNLITDEDYEIDNIGMSESSVLIYKNKVLKIQEYNEEAENEYRMLQYLHGKLPVPLVYAHEILNSKSYLLMSKCAGEILQWLYENKPEEKLVLSHGDYCLPNIFSIHGEVTGYIDLGRTGIADKWCDIALCYRSLLHNYSGKYKYHENNTYSDYDELLLFHELGIKPDWEKIRYYILLNELF